MQRLQLDSEDIMIALSTRNRGGRTFDFYVSIGYNRHPEETILTTWIDVNPSSRLGGTSFIRIASIASSGTTRWRIRLRIWQTSTGTSKNTASISQPNACAIFT